MKREPFFQWTIIFLIGWSTACSPTPRQSPRVSSSAADHHAIPQSYMVRPGDTLTQVARQFSVSVKELQSINQIENPADLSIGTRLVIPPKPPESKPGKEPESNPSALPVAFQWPLHAPQISSFFGWRNTRHHDGIDLRAPQGTSIYAAADGTVKLSDWVSGYGNLIIVQHTDQITTHYAHNHLNLVKAGATVQQGQLIAKVGSTGNATGPHVHFEIRMWNKPVNPQEHLPPLPGQEPPAIASLFP